MRYHLKMDHCNNIQIDEFKINMKNPLRSMDFKNDFENMVLNESPFK